MRWLFVFIIFCCSKKCLAHVYRFGLLNIIIDTKLNPYRTEDNHHVGTNIFRLARFTKTPYSFYYSTANQTDKNDVNQMIVLCIVGLSLHMQTCVPRFVQKHTHKNTHTMARSQTQIVYIATFIHSDANIFLQPKNKRKNSAITATTIWT